MIKHADYLGIFFIKHFIWNMTSENFFKRKWLIIVPCLFAFLFALFAVWFYGFEKIWFGDTEDYINGANAFLNGTPYPRRSVFHPMFRPPLFYVIRFLLVKCFSWIRAKSI